MSKAGMSKAGLALEQMHKDKLRREKEISDEAYYIAMMESEDFLGEYVPEQEKTKYSRAERKAYGAQFTKAERVAYIQKRFHGKAVIREKCKYSRAERKVYGLQFTKAERLAYINKFYKGGK